MKITIPLPGNWCIRNSSGNVLLLHAVGDIGIFFSYMLVTLAIVLFLWHRPHYRSTFLWLTTAFIFLCGLTHLASIWTLYVSPEFAFDGALKVVTFAVSLAAALAAPGAFLDFAEAMHDRNNKLQELALDKAQLAQQISEMNESIARRDQNSQDRQESIMQHQIESAQVIERLADTLPAVLRETREVLTVAREASERILSRDPGEKRDGE